MKETLKPLAYKPSEPGGVSWVTACLLKNEPASSPRRRVKQVSCGAGVKASLKWAMVAGGRPETG